MAFVASQRNAQQIDVTHDGHLWSYDFHIGKHDPILRGGRVQWAQATEPADADALTREAKAEAFTLARAKGLATKFETVSIIAARIRVRCIHSEHEVTFTVHRKPNGGRILESTVDGHPNEATGVNLHSLVLQARSFAEAEMLAAGKIDDRASM